MLKLLAMLRKKQRNQSRPAESGNKFNPVPMFAVKSIYTVENASHKLKGLYSRVLIKNKHPENSEQRSQIGQKAFSLKVFVAKISGSMTKKAA